MNHRNGPLMHTRFAKRKASLRVRLPPHLSSDFQFVALGKTTIKTRPREKAMTDMEMEHDRTTWYPLRFVGFIAMPHMSEPRG